MLPSLLEASPLDERDRRFATDLVYGTTRMRRACDFLVDRFLIDPGVDTDVRLALRLGAYQLHFQQAAPHAAVSETVSLVPRRVRGLLNAVLRKVATAPVHWPDDPTRLSYPDWIVERLVTDLGREAALAALEAMNEPATVHRRDDGYVQDPASTAVTDMLGARAGELVADICAAPGGKATAVAADGAFVVAGDRRASRLGLVVDNARSTATADRVAAFAADGRSLPLRSGSVDRVLVDAPCSGLGVLRRRADARWRMTPGDVDDLVALQRELVTEGARVLAPGGRMVYSVCTLTHAEGPAMGEWIAASVPGLRAVDLASDDTADLPPGWEPVEVGARVLPTSRGSDGMYAAAFTSELPSAG